MLSDKLHIDHRKIELERAHRTGRPSSSSTRPRPIVVKFLRYKDKLEVLTKVKALNDTDIFIDEVYHIIIIIIYIYIYIYIYYSTPIIPETCSEA